MTRKFYTPIDMTTDNKIVNVKDPTDEQDAATKKYVDTAAAAKFLVTEASAALSAEIVVGATPGGELGGTWDSPTVDATHAGSAHLALGSTGSTAAAGDHTHPLASSVWRPLMDGAGNVVTDGATGEAIMALT